MKKASRTWLFGASGLLLMGLVAVVMLWCQPAVGRATSPLDVTVTKTASASAVAPGQSLSYTVAFSNNSPTDVALDAVTDTLPAGFEFGGMDPASDWLTAPVAAPDLVWQGPITIPATSTLALVYHVTASVPASTTPYVNTVTAVAEGTTIGPATATVLVGHRVFLPLVFVDFEAARFAITKSAFPDNFVVGTVPLVTYWVVITNEGDTPGVLATIQDTLPASFVYMSMVSGSGVTSNPTVAGRTLTWTGPFTVSAHSLLSLGYQVIPSGTPGQHTNSASVAVQQGTPPPGPATATVTIKPDALLQDNFDANADQWTPFLNYHRLHPEQWYWEDSVGVSGGAYNHNRYLGSLPGKEADDALSMYLGPEADGWTNYRFEAWVYAAQFSPEEDVEKAGLWFRGHYQEHTTSGKWVLGYYFFIQPGSTNVFAEIWQTETANDCVSVCDSPRWQNTFNTLMRLERKKCSLLTSQWYNNWHKLAVEVRGNNMKGYLDDQLVIDFTDTVGDILLNGTVGLPCYKAPLLRYDSVLVTELP